MSKFDILEIDSREVSSDAHVRTLRTAGIVPGVMYGGKEEPRNISVREIVLSKLIDKRGAFSKVFTAKSGNDECFVVIRDVQFHPVTCRPRHIDLMRVKSGSLISVKVPIVYLNEALSPAIKKGGVLNIVVHEIDLACDVSTVPESIIVDLNGMDFHQSIKITDLKIPAGSKIITKLPSNATVITIVAPSGLRSEMNKDASAEETQTPATTPTTATP